MPNDYHLGPAVHGVIGSFYFYEENSRDDAAFGFFGIEVSVQRLADTKLRVELYCVADGYQSSRGVGGNHPLRISVMSRDAVIATAEWRFSDVICGHADPMSFSADLDVATPFEAIDSIALEKVEGQSAPCR